MWCAGCTGRGAGRAGRRPAGYARLGGSDERARGGFCRHPTPPAVQGPKSERLQAAIRGLDPQLAGWVDEFVFGGVWERPGLSEQERLIIAVGMLAAGRHPEQLRAYLFGSGFAGVPAEKVREVLVMCTVCAEFPSALQALGLWQEVRASLDRQR